jgi:hypothetical protein
MDILIENETITQGPSAEGTILPCTGGCAGMEMLDELAEWDLVCISDSTGLGIAERYAENIRRDTGKSVRVRDYATGNLSAIRVLNALRTEAGNLTDERFRSLRADITDAEVIVLFANPRGDPSRGGIDTGIEGYISLERTPSNCTLELYQPYIENLKRVYEEVLALRAGSPTIVRALDLYNPLISVHRERNMEK